MVRFKKIFSTACTFLALLGTAVQDADLTGTVAQTLLGSEQISRFDNSIENQRFKLSCDYESGNILLFDKLTGKSFSGIPDGVQENSNIKGIDKMELSSQLIVSAMDNLTGQVNELTSYASSVRKGAVKVQQIKNGFKVIYNFESEKLTIPVCFTIDDEFNVQIPVSEIIDGKAKKIHKIELLPFFGAGSDTDTGFILVPDGSGAVINFNNGKAKGTEYNAQVYGRDDSFYLKLNSLVTERVSLPVFGIEKNGAGFLAVIEDGAGAAFITASSADNRKPYNRAGFAFVYRSVDTAYLNKDTWYEKGVLKINDYPEVENISVAYHFYEKPFGGISSMAEIYRSILKSEDKKKTDVVPELILDILCAIDRNKSILGFPANVISVLTEFDETGQIIDSFRKLGIDDISVKLSGTSNSAVRYKVKNGWSPLLALGGKRSFRNLISDKEVDFYIDCDAIYFDAGFFDFNVMIKGVKSLSGEAAFKYQYDIATYQISSTSRKFGMLKPGRLSKTYQNIMKDIRNFDVGISPGKLGSSLYSDFSKDNTVPRQQVMKLVQKIYSEVLNDKKVLSTSPNAYAISGSDLLLEIPDSSSKFDIFDYDVPFYSMVLMRMRRFTYSPLNLTADAEKLKLRILQTGASPFYKLFSAPSEAVKETDYNAYYSCNYLQWLDDAAKFYKKCAEFYSSERGAITDFQKLTDCLEKVSYSDGSMWLFNFSDQEKTVDGVTIEPFSMISVQ